MPTEIIPNPDWGRPSPSIEDDVVYEFEEEDDDFDEDE